MPYGNAMRNREMPLKLSFREKKINKQIAACQSELLATHYAEVENMYRQMRGWRHDYRNHIQVLKSYLAMGGRRLPAIWTRWKQI